MSDEFQLFCQITKYHEAGLVKIYRRIAIPKYSNTFRKKLKAIKAAQESLSMVIAIMKGQQPSYLFVLTASQLLLVANAKLRDWILIGSLPMLFHKKRRLPNYELILNGCFNSTLFKRGLD